MAEERERQAASSLQAMKVEAQHQAEEEARWNAAEDEAQRELTRIRTLLLERERQLFAMQKRAQATSKVVQREEALLARCVHEVGLRHHVLQGHYEVLLDHARQGEPP